MPCQIHIPNTLQLLMVADLATGILQRALHKWIQLLPAH